MSGFWSVLRLGRIVSECPLYSDTTLDPYGIMGPLMVALDFYPHLLTLTLYAITLYHNELYFLLLSICLTLDTFVSVGLQYAIGLPSRFPGCGNQYEMPSFSSQHITLFITMVLTFSSVWRRSIAARRIVLINTGMAFTQIARVYIGINRSSELFFGCMVGLIESALFQCIIYFIIYPLFDAILNTRLARFMNLEDNLCRDDLRVLHHRVLNDDRILKQFSFLIMDHTGHTERDTKKLIWKRMKRQQHSDSHVQ
jgi:hypothetical protein